MSSTPLNPDQFRFFDPDNPPLAFDKEKGNERLKEIKARVFALQVERMQRHNAARKAERG